MTKVKVHKNTGITDEKRKPAYICPDMGLKRHLSHKRAKAMKLNISDKTSAIH